MKFTLTFLATITLLSAQLGYAEPIPNILNIDLTQKTGRVLNTPARLKQALNKYGLESPRMSSTQLDLVASTIDLSSVHVDVEYVGKIGIGTPPQIFSMDFDTGSADIWVPYVDCARCGQHPLFDPTDSSTLSLATGNETWALRYGDGSGVQGITATDTIHLDDLSVANQTIGLAVSMSMDFATDPELDGIFGLSFPSLSYTGTKQSVVQAMYNEGIIKSPEVGVWLGHARDGGKGEITFGQTNPKHYEGELKYIPVSVEKYWQVPFNGVKVKGQEILEKPLQAIIDTGTTLIILPTELSEAIHAAIPGASFSNMYGWRLPCELKSADADAQVVFTLGEHEFSMNMADLVRERAAPGSDDGEELCYSGIAEARTPLIIMGDTFLRSYYSVYDFGKSAVGLAPAKP